MMSAHDVTFKKVMRALTFKTTFQVAISVRTQSDFAATPTSRTPLLHACDMFMPFAHSHSYSQTTFIDVPHNIFPQCCSTPTDLKHVHILMENSSHLVQWRIPLGNRTAKRSRVKKLKIEEIVQQQNNNFREKHCCC